MIRTVEHPIEELQIVLVDEAKLAEAEQWLAACERCAENGAIAFDYVLDALTGCDPAVTYVMCRPARCPCCSSNITEKTLVVV